MIVVVMGVSASGKTTVGKKLAARLGATFRDADDYHSKTNLEAMRSGHPLDDAMRWPWLEAMQHDIRAFAASGKSLVLACSALRRSYREHILSRARDSVLIYLRGDKQAILRRMQARKGHFFPPSLLDSQFRTLEEPESDENVITIPASLTVADAVDLAIDRLSKTRAHRLENNKGSPAI